MDVKNMTLRDFLEYAELYPYTEDRYMLEKALMELNLIEMHIESYNFITNNDLNGEQLDTLMVESGINDKSHYEIQLYTEKANIIVKSLKKLIDLIVKAIRTSMGSFAKMCNVKIETLSKNINKEEEILKAIENGSLDLKKLPDDILNNIISVHNNFAEEYKKYYESDGALKIIIGVSKDNNIFKIEKDINSNLNSKILETMVTLCANEFTVNGLKFIANFESFVDEFKNVIEQFNNIKDDHDTNIKNIAASISKLRKDLSAQCRSNASFKINEEVFKVKQAKSDELNNVEIIDFTEEYKSLSKILQDEHALIKELYDASTMIIKLLIATMNLSKFASKTHIEVISILYNYISNSGSSNTDNEKE